MTEQFKALRLADALKGQVQVNPRVGENDPDCGYVHELDKLIDEAAAELRRLHAVNAELLALLKEVSEETRHRDYDWTVDLAQRVRAAIARAEGKT